MARLGRQTKLFWTLALVQLGVVLVPLGIHFDRTASEDIAHPDHVDAWFVYTWSFQISMFALFYLLPTVLCVALIVWIEWVVLRFVQWKRKPDEHE
jgi:hypothetical protein